MIPENGLKYIFTKYKEPNKYDNDIYKYTKKIFVEFIYHNNPYYGKIISYNITLDKFKIIFMQGNIKKYTEKKLIDIRYIDRFNYIYILPFETCNKQLMSIMNTSRYVTDIYDKAKIICISVSQTYSLGQFKIDFDNVIPLKKDIPIFFEKCYVQPLEDQRYRFTKSNIYLVTNAYVNSNPTHIRIIDNRGIESEYEQYIFKKVVK